MTNSTTTITTPSEGAGDPAEDPAFAVHVGGKIEIASRTPVEGPEHLSLVYTPGVGRVSQAVADDPDRVWELTGRSNAVAVLSNGTAVLGLGGYHLAGKAMEARIPDTVRDLIENGLGIPGK